VGQRAFWEPHTVLVTGAGPIGLLAALVAHQHGVDVHVFDRAESGPKPDLVRALGATYHTGSVREIGFEPDVVIECTGAGAVIGDAVATVAPGGIVCLTGVGSGGRVSAVSVAEIGATIVLRNNVVVGSVNANKRHWFKAAQALARADREWLSRLITRRVRPADFVQALTRQPDDIKVIIQFSEA
jgi:threonine dehydrogenase-like Zn-dependent dehydrogenase